MWLLVVVGALVMSCRTEMVQLTEQGMNVAVQESRPSGTDVKQIGQYDCHRAMNGRSPAKNQRICTNEIRNKAAKDGADFVVLDVSHRSNSNSVSVVGAGYRRLE